MRFALAPMDLLFRVLTGLVLAMPLLLVVLTLITGPVAPFMLATLVFLLGIYAGVWFACRPSYFAVDRDGLQIVFPWWTRRIPAAVLRSVERYPGSRYADEVGWGLRVGVGGLWGVFGWLYTPIGWVEVYSSRVGDVVLVRCADRIPLLLSPDDVDGFADAVEGILPREA